MVERSILHEARKKKGLNQLDVAERIGVSQATVSYWETCTTSPHPSLWGQIARIYGVRIADLTEHFRAAKAS